MCIKKISRKILLILFGIVIGFIIVEAGLNVLEFMYKKKFKLSVEDEFDFASKACRIICLGDSWTYGMGVVRQEDYPTQLENILNNFLTVNSNFKVYNLGYPNFTSSMAMKKFKDVYPLLKPNIVIAMIGRSDQWIFESRNIEKKFIEKIKHIVFNTRVAKLINVSEYNIRYNIFRKKGSNLFRSKKYLGKAMVLIEAGNDYRTKRMFLKAEDCYNKAIFLIPDLRVGFIEKARNAKLNGKYEEALTCLGKTFIDNIEDKEIIQELNDIFLIMKGPQRKVEFYYRFFQKSPYSIVLRYQLVRAYIELAEFLYVDKQFDAVLKNYKKALQLEPENKEIYSSIIYNQVLINKSVVVSMQDSPLQESKIAYSSSQKTILENNLYELVKICKQNNIELIFSGYPIGIPVAVQRVAADCGIPLIDHGPAFKTAKGDCFVPDGHCTSAGYKIVAENLAGYILTDKKNKLGR